MDRILAVHDVGHRGDDRSLGGNLVHSSWSPSGGEELSKLVLDAVIDVGREHVVEVVVLGHFIASTLDGKRLASRFSARWWLTPTHTTSWPMTCATWAMLRSPSTLSMMTSA